MASTIRLVQGDDLPGIMLVIRDARTAAAGQELDKKDPTTWAPVNLTGCVVSAQVSRLGDTVGLEAIPCFVSQAVSGQVLITLQQAVFIQDAGLYQIEITVDFPQGQQTVYDMLQLDVRERIRNVS